MKIRVGLMIVIGTAAALCCSASASELKQIGAIAVPGEKLTNFDISFTDQVGGRLFFADRSNKAVDIFDTKTEHFLTRAGDFAGAVTKDGKVVSKVSGPDGVVFTGTEIWAGDGNSTVKIIDPTTGATKTAISTGGATRVDEMAYDPKDQVFIGINNAEHPPFATLISTKPDHALIGKLVLQDATDGAEQPAYNPDDGLFYLSVPELGNEPRRGGIAVIDPRTAKLVKILPIENCHPAGLAFGPDGNFIVGCDADGKEMPPSTTIMNAKTGAVVARIPGLGGSDMVNYNARNGQYYTASQHNPGGPVIGVIDAKTNGLVQTIPITGGTPHSVTSSEATGHVYVPVGATGGGDGTIHVYAP